MKTHNVIPANAAKFRDWIKNRGGIAVWENQEIGSSYAKSWSTPATVRLGDCHETGAPITDIPICPHCWNLIRQENKPEGVEFLQHCTVCSKYIPREDLILPYPRPNWRCGNKSPEIFKTEAEILVEIPEVFKTIPLTHRKDDGDLTIGCKRELNEACKECQAAKNAESWFEISDDDKTAKILYVSKLIPLNEYNEKA